MSQGRIQAVAAAGHLPVVFVFGPLAGYRLHPCLLPSWAAARSWTCCRLWSGTRDGIEPSALR